MRCNCNCKIHLSLSPQSQHYYMGFSIFGGVKFDKLRRSHSPTSRAQRRLEKLYSSWFPRLFRTPSGSPSARRSNSPFTLLSASSDCPCLLHPSITSPSWSANLRATATAVAAASHAGEVQAFKQVTSTTVSGRNKSTCTYTRITI